MRVKSAVDNGYRILMGGTGLLIVVSLLIMPEKERVIGFAVGIPVLCFLLSMYTCTYYEFREEYLYCRSGPFVEKIAYKSIKSVKLSQNRFSSMALSSKRIEIRQNGKGYIVGTTYISPVNREEFLAELTGRCRRFGGLED